MLNRSPSSPHAPGDGVADASWLDATALKMPTVTNLNANGPGSLRAALNQTGPRIVIFEVGGVINLKGTPLKIGKGQGNVYVAGQTAPGPGITIIRGPLKIHLARNVVLQHIRVRPGTEINKVSDAIDVRGNKNVRGNLIFDHCSVTWGSDETLTVARTSSTSPYPNTAEPVTITNTIIAEGLENTDLHKEDNHGFGSLLYGGYQYTLAGNLWANNSERNPWIGNYSGPCRAAVVNNLVAGASRRAMMVEANGKMDLSFIGNKLHGGDRRIDLDKTPNNRGETASPRHVYFLDNQARLMSLDKWNIVNHPPAPLGEIEPYPVEKVVSRVTATVGARPAMRTPHDRRIIRAGRTGTGRLIDSQKDVGGYPELKTVRRDLSVPSDTTALARWLYRHTQAVERPNVDPP